MIQWEMIWSQCFENRLIQMIIQSCRFHRSCSVIWMIQFICHVYYCSRVISIRSNWEINRESKLLWNCFECSEHLQLVVQLWIFWRQSWFFQLLLLFNWLTRLMSSWHVFLSKHQILVTWALIHQNVQCH